MHAAAAPSARRARRSCAAWAIRIRRWSSSARVRARTRTARANRSSDARAGELLTRMLAAIGLRREDVFITNTIKCRATTEENGRVFNRAPMQEEMANCREYLDIELSVLKPRVVLALGAPAAKSFQGAGFSITRQRGVWSPGPLGSDLIVTFHPAYILRLTGG